MPLEEVMKSTFPLCLIALVTLSMATWLFRRRME
jgi:ABC-2 type transport system permease protein